MAASQYRTRQRLSRKPHQLLPGSAQLSQLSQARVARMIVDHYYPPAGGNDPQSCSGHKAGRDRRQAARNAALGGTPVPPHGRQRPLAQREGHSCSVALRVKP